jgi:hypothetical protein
VNQKPTPLVRFALALPLILLGGGCSTQAWYEGLRISAESECYKLPPGAVAECLARLNKKTHEEYEKERTSK